MATVSSQRATSQVWWLIGTVNGQRPTWQKSHTSLSQWRAKKLPPKIDGFWAQWRSKELPPKLDGSWAQWTAKELYHKGLMPHCHIEEPKSYLQIWMAHEHSEELRSNLANPIQPFPGNFTSWTFIWHSKNIKYANWSLCLKVHTSMTHSVTEIFCAPYTCHLQLPLNQSIAPNVLH